MQKSIQLLPNLIRTVLSSVRFTCYLITFVLLESLSGNKENMAGLQLLGEASCLSPAQVERLLPQPSTVCCLEPCDIVTHPAGHLPQHNANSFGAGTVFGSSLFPSPHLVSKCSRKVACPRCAVLTLFHLRVHRPCCLGVPGIDADGALVLVVSTSQTMAPGWPSEMQSVEGSPSAASVLRTSSQIIVTF